jgi:hypothetical protein
MAEAKAQLSHLSAEILVSAEFSDDAKLILVKDSTPMGYVGKLSEASLFPDAIKYLAHSFEGRSSINWALSCARQLQPNSTAVEQNALTAVERWLADSTETNRRDAQSSAEGAQLSTPAGCIALAAFFAEGSIAPPGANAIPPPPGVSQKLAAAGIILAVVAEPEKAPERYRCCLQLGLQTAS